MDTSKMKHLFKNVNLSISLFMGITIVLQFLLIAMTVGAVWVIDVLLPITTLLLILNLGFGGFVLYQIIFKRKKEYHRTIVWILVNQFLLFIGLIILVASGMTLVNF